jgi:hypothetical protein
MALACGQEKQKITKKMKTSHFYMRLAAFLSIVLLIAAMLAIALSE